jgi:hypothetical protein
MIDNFEQINNLLKFEDENEFYWIQIIQRKKENPELGSNNRMIRAYYIFSNEQLVNYKEEIVKLCSLFNARAYIHLNRRNSKDISLELLINLAERIKNNQFHSLQKIYETICGEHHSKKDKTWIVDIDTKDMNEVYKIHDAIKNIEPVGNKTKAIIPTKNGYHLITTGFNSQKFSLEFPTIDLHRNNPSILYVPEIK